MSPFLETQDWAKQAGLKTLAFESTTSSNDEAKSRPPGEVDLVLARYQTQGRGRGDHSWVAEPDQALLSSWCFQLPDLPQPVFAVRVGLALYRAANETWPAAKFALKAPNDLHIFPKAPANTGADFGSEPQKLGGLLIEIVTTPKTGSLVIVGLGLNVTSSPKGTTPFTSASLFDLGLDLTQWSKFLTAWHSGLLAAVARAGQLTLTQTERDHATHALRRHPLYHDVKSVREDGSLERTSGEITPWFMI